MSILKRLSRIPQKKALVEWTIKQIQLKEALKGCYGHEVDQQINITQALYKADLAKHQEELAETAELLMLITNPYIQKIAYLRIFERLRWKDIARAVNSKEDAVKKSFYRYIERLENEMSNQIEKAG